MPIPEAPSVEWFWQATRNAVALSEESTKAYREALAKEADAYAAHGRALGPANDALIDAYASAHEGQEPSEAWMKRMLPVKMTHEEIILHMAENEVKACRAELDHAERLSFLLSHASRVLKGEMFLEGGANELPARQYVPEIPPKFFDPSPVPQMPAEAPGRPLGASLPPAATGVAEKVLQALGGPPGPLGRPLGG